MADIKLNLVVTEKGGRVLSVTNQKLRQTETSAGKARKALSGMFVGLAAGAGIAALGAVTMGAAALARELSDSVREFASFDAAMTQSVAIMGDVSDAMKDDMSAVARQMAKDLGLAAEDTARSYFYLASAGLDAAESMEALPIVATFAKAGVFDLALATDLLTDAQSALGLASADMATHMENMTRVSDVFVKANTLANASVEQFSVAMTSKAGAALKAFGKDVEEGVAVLAALADQGVKGELAGNALSISIRNLTTAAVKNEKAFDRLGVRVFDDAGKMSHFADIIGDLEKALAGQSDEMKKATLLQLGFADKAQGTLLALLGTSDAIREYDEQLRDAAGTTKDVAEKQMESFAEQMNQLKAELTDISIDIGAALVPALLELAKGFRDDVLPALRDFSAWAERNAGTFKRMAADVNHVIRDLVAVSRWLAEVTGQLEEAQGDPRAAAEAARQAIAASEAAKKAMLESTNVAYGHAEAVAADTAQVGDAVVVGKEWAKVLELVAKAQGMVLGQAHVAMKAGVGDSLFDRLLGKPDRGLDTLRQLAAITSEFEEASAQAAFMSEHAFGFAAAMERAGMPASAIAGALQDMGADAVTVASVLGTYGPQLDDAGGATRDWSAALRQVADDAQKIQGIFQELSGLLSTLGAEGLAQTASGLSDIAGGVGGIAAAVAMFPTDPLGAIQAGLSGLGSIASGVAGLLASEVEEVNDLRDAFLESHGGWLAFQQELAQATDEDLLAAIFNAGTVDEFNAAVLAATDALDEHQRQQELMLTAQNALQEAVDRYGFTIDQLGPTMQRQMLNEQAAMLLQDFELLIASGMDMETVLGGMDDAINQYVQDSLAAGQAIPESMRPMIEAMIEQGLLLDENGNAFGSVEEAGLSFTQSLEEGLGDAVDAIRELVAALTGIGPVNIPVNVNYSSTGEPPGGPDSDWRGPDRRRHLATGGIVEEPTVAVVGEDGPEVVAPVAAHFARVTAPILRALDEMKSGGGAGPQSFLSELDGEVLARWIERKQLTGEIRIHPDAIQEYG